MTEWTNDDWETPHHIAMSVAVMAFKYRGTGVSRFVEPFAGHGNIAMALKRLFPHVPVWANELNKDRYEIGKKIAPNIFWTNRDFRDKNSTIGYYNNQDQIVTNPPFSLAIEAIEFFFSLPSPPDTVMMLLPIDFFCSKKRFERIKNLDKCYIETMIPIVGRVAYLKEGEAMRNRQIYDALYVMRPGNFSQGQKFITQD